MSHYLTGFCTLRLFLTFCLPARGKDLGRLGYSPNRFCYTDIDSLASISKATRTHKFFPTLYSLRCFGAAPGVHILKAVFILLCVGWKIAGSLSDDGRVAGSALVVG